MSDFQSQFIEALSDGITIFRYRPDSLLFRLLNRLRERCFLQSPLQPHRLLKGTCCLLECARTPDETSELRLHTDETPRILKGTLVFVFHSAANDAPSAYLIHNPLRPWTQAQFSLRL